MEMGNPTSSNKRSALSILLTSFVCGVSLFYAATSFFPSWHATSTGWISHGLSAWDDVSVHAIHSPPSDRRRLNENTGSLSPSASTSPFCDQLPLDSSLSHLWNTQMPNMEMMLKSLEATGDPSMAEWIGPLLHFFSTHYLRSTIKSQPIQHRWHSLINKMQHRREWVLQQMKGGAGTTAQRRRMEIVAGGDNPSQPPVIAILVVGAEVAAGKGYCNLNTASEKTNDNEYCARAWPQRLEQLINRLLVIESLEDIKASTTTALNPPIVQVLPILIANSTTEFSIPILKHGLWKSMIQSSTLPNTEVPNYPDIVINAYSSHDTFSPFPKSSTTEDGANPQLPNVMKSVDYTEQHRRTLQEWIRTVMDMSHDHISCAANDDDPVTMPIPFLLDDYLGNHHGYLLAETIQARLLQRMADWYQIPFISYAASVRSLVWSSNSAGEPDNGYADAIGIIAPDWSTKNGDVKESTNVLLPETAHFLITWSLLFGMAQFTMDACNAATNIPNPDSAKLLLPGVQDMVDNVVPPPLTLALTLDKATAEWKAAQQQQIQHVTKLKAEQCPKPNNGETPSGLGHPAECPLFFWPSNSLSPSSSSSSNIWGRESVERWQSADGNSNKGWSWSPDGVLQAPAPTADTISWNVDMPQKASILQIFVVTYSGADDNSQSPMLQVKVSPGSAGNAAEDLIATAHASDVDVSLPHTIPIQIPTDATKNTIQIEFTRIDKANSNGEKSVVGIAGVFLCSQ